MTEDEFEKDSTQTAYWLLGVAACLCLLAALMSYLLGDALPDGMKLTNQLATVMALVFAVAGFAVLLVQSRRRKRK